MPPGIRTAQQVGRWDAQATGDSDDGDQPGISPAGLQARYLRRMHACSQPQSLLRQTGGLARFADILAKPGARVALAAPDRHPWTVAVPDRYLNRGSVRMRPVGRDIGRYPAVGKLGRRPC